MLTTEKLCAEINADNAAQVLKLKVELDRVQKELDELKALVAVAGDLPALDNSNTLRALESVQFKGRGFQSPTTAIMVHPEGVSLRVDCRKNPEAWGELWVPVAALAYLLGACAAQQDAAPVGLVGLIDRIGGRLAK